MSDICRICLQKQSIMFSIYDKYSDECNEPICDMIMYCASVKIEKGDGLPNLLCEFCKRRLETAYLFKRDCEESENKLRQYIRMNGINYYNQLKKENDDFNPNPSFPLILLEDNSEIDRHHSQNSIKKEDSDDDDKVNDIDDNSFDAVEPKLEVHSIKPETFQINTIHSECKQQDSDDDVKFALKNEEFMPKKPKKRRSRAKTDGVKLRRFICYSCSTIFYSDNDLRVHMFDEHPNQKYFCDFENCNREFSEYLKYADHCHTDHYVENFLVCQKCHTTYRRKKNLDRHILTKHCDRPQQCLQCLKRFPDTKALELHMNIHMEKYECLTCKKCFSTHVGLENHKRVHSSESNQVTHACDKCNQNFSSKVFLDQHSCDQNPSLTSEEKSDLSSQKQVSVVKGGKRKSRTKVRNHLCSICGRTFPGPTALNIHIRLHTGVKPFKCEQCDYRCHRPKLLKNHRRTHTGEKPYKCSYCEKAFNSRGYLTIHERFHSGYRPFVCTACDKGFTNSKDLKVHARTHTGVKLFSCEICGNSFTTLHYLRVHTSKHGKGV